MTQIQSGRPDVFNCPYFFKETTEGTSGAALTQFRELNFTLEANINTTQYRTIGSRFASAAVVGKKWTGIKGTASPFCYDEFAYVMDWCWGYVAPATPGGGTNSRTRTWNPSMTYETDPITATIKQGDKMTRAHQTRGSFLTGYELNWDTEKFEVMIEGLGRRFEDNIQLDTNEVQSMIKTGTVTGGTFTLTVTNPQTGGSGTTAAIAYNASAVDIQTALELLTSIILPGEIICAGGPSPSVAVTFTFRGRFGQTNVAALVADSTSITGGGSMTVSTTTPGVAPTLLAGIIATAQDVKVYIDPTYGAIGTTKYARCYGGSAKITNIRALEFVVDRDLAGSPKGRVPQPVTGTISLNLAADDQGQGIQFAAIDGTNPTQFMRIEAIGETIEGSLKYTFQHDFAVQLTKAPPFSSNQSVIAGAYEFIIVSDSGYAKAMNIFLQNALAAVA